MLRLGGVEHPARDQKVHRPRLADQPGQDQRHGLAGEDRLTGADVADQDVVPRDPEITGQRCHPAGSVTAPVERRHHWFGGLHDRLHEQVMGTEVGEEPDPGMPAFVALTHPTDDVIAG